MRNARIATLAFTLVLFGLCISLQSVSAAEPENSFYFDKETGTITKYVGDSTTVDIPPSIRGVQVKSIGWDEFTGLGAFQGKTKVQSVIIPDGVRTIDQKAFFHCSSLHSVSMPNTVESIGINAFGECSALKNMTLSSNLSRIEPYAFSNMGLESILIPDKVTVLDFSAFSFCRSLKSVTLPAKLTEIRDTAFYQCTALQRITIPSQVNSIGSSFGLCSSLSNVYFEGNAPKLTGVPFDGVTNLKVYYKPSATGFSSTWNGFAAAPYNYKVTYMANLNAGDTYVIDEVGCLQNTNLVVGDSKGFGAGTYTLLYWTLNPDGSGTQYRPQTDSLLVDSNKILYGKWEPVSGVNPASDFRFDTNTGTITQYRGASGKVVIPSIINVNGTAFGVKAIGTQAFQNKTQVQSVVIPNGVTSIGQNAFAVCTALNSITIPDSATNFDNMGNIFYKCSALKTVHLPADITKVVQGMFNTSGLEHITIPSKVGSLGDCAFYGCGRLKTMCFEGNAPSLLAHTGGIDAGKVVVFEGVPSTMKVYYKSGRTGFTPVWNGFTTAPYDYKVSYMANRFPQDTDLIDLAPYVKGADAVVAGIGSYINHGYKFIGWATNPDGSGTQYSANDSLKITNDITLYARWEPITYTVSTAANPEQGGMTSGGGAYPEGKTVGVIATTNNGYRFVNWTENGNQVSTSGTYSFAIGTVDRALVANFVHLFTVNVAAVTGGSISAGVSTAEEGATVNLSITPDGGQRLKVGSLKYNDGTKDTVITGTSFTMPAGNVTVTAEFETIPPTTYTVTFFKNGGDTEANPDTKTVLSGGNVGTLPVDPTRAGYSFSGWNTVADGTGTAFKADTAVSADLSVYAQWTVKSNGGGGSSSGGGGNIGGGAGTAVPESKPTAPITSTIQTETKSDVAGKASAVITEKQIKDAVNYAISEAIKNKGMEAKVEIKVSTSAEAKTVEISLPKAAVKAVADSQTDAMTASTSVANITFDKVAISTISKEATGDIKVIASKVDVSSLSEAEKAVVGDRPVFNFSVTSGDKIISQFGGTVTVSVPYMPKAGEDTNAIVIYYINAEGKMEIVKDCVYDKKKGRITFHTNHFSKYAVGYHTVSFKDVDSRAWYYAAISFVAARGITTGVDNDNFCPEGNLTRGQFLVMVMRAYGLEPDSNLHDNFSDAGKTYYTAYLATAKKLGITAGIGNNMFAPDKEISRQEMFTLLYNTLKQLGELPANTSGNTLSSYADANEVASWANEAMTLFVKTGTLSGNGGKLNPKESTNRAQMAQVLYLLMSE